MKKYEFGNTTVEFVLMFPFLFLIFLGMLDLAFLFLNQTTLQNMGRSLARGLAWDLTSNQQQMNKRIRIWLKQNGHADVHSNVLLKTLNTKEQNQVFRQKKAVDLVSLKLERPHKSLFPLVQLLSGGKPWVLETLIKDVRVKPRK